MAKQILPLRKRRTREHVIADQSINYVERYIYYEGHTAQRLGSDYGYDSVLFTFDKQGYPEPGLIYLQFKAAETLHPVGSHYVFDLDVRDYHLWTFEEMPVILILFDASRRRAYWLAVQDYFRADAARRPKKGAKTVRLRVSMRRVVNRWAIVRMSNLKRKALNRPAGEES
jgi:hypothetical protein